MRVFLSEKPDQAKIISAALGSPEKAKGYHRCGSDYVTWCFGHLLMPKMPEDYDPALKQWTWSTLPMLPQPFGFRPRDKAAGQIRVISDLLKQANEVVIATDADREGELIAYEVLTHLKWRGPTNRLWLSDLTPAAVKKALADIRPGSQTKPLYHAAFARMCADWIVGLNGTRAVTLKLRSPEARTPFSVGRVQTPTLALVVRTERRIRNFKPETYYELVARVATQSGHTVVMRFAPPPEKRIKDRSRIEAGKAQAEGQTAPVRVQTEDKTQPPPELLDLNRLQQEANRRFGFSADRTLQLAQSLYETHQVLTYPRTDSTALPEEHTERIPQILDNLSRIDALSDVAKIPEPVVRKRYYDDGKVTAHHAIVPTLKPCDMAALNEDEAKIYDLVARHFLAAHMPDFAYKATSMTCKPGNVPFRARGSVPTQEGWRIAFNGVPDETETDPEKEDNPDLPPVPDGDPGTARDVKIDEKVTKPPERYTEASLLKRMRNIASEVEDADAKKRLKETSGIGTPATRAGIIETLKKRKYITVNKKKIVPTDGGEGLITAIEASLPGYADPVVTAQWEDELDAIAQKSADPRDFINRIATQVKSDVQTLKDASDLPMFDAKGKQMSAEERKGAAQRQQEQQDPEARAARQAHREAALARGRPLKVAYAKRDRAKQLGAVWNKDKKTWMMHPDADPAPFVREGFLPDEKG